MQSFGNWLDVKGEGEEESKLNPSFQFEWLSELLAEIQERYFRVRAAWVAGLENV